MESLEFGGEFFGTKHSLAPSRWGEERERGWVGGRREQKLEEGIERESCGRPLRGEAIAVAEEEHKCERKMLVSDETYHCCSCSCFATSSPPASLRFAIALHVYDLFAVQSERGLAHAAGRVPASPPAF